MTETPRYAIIDTSWGSFGMVAGVDGLVATYLPDHQEAVARAIKQRWPGAVNSPDLLPAVQRDVKRYFEGRRVSFSARIDLDGIPPFRRAVLEACRRIPYGQTASYSDLARAGGSPRAVRAAGGAMASNPLPLIVPCHRVLRQDGSIGGFSSPEGVAQKLRLLRLENTLLDSRFLGKWVETGSQSA